MACSSAQTFHFSTQVPSLHSWPPPARYLHGHHLYRLSVHFQVPGHLLSGHASVPWQAPGHSHSSIFQHIPRFYRASNSLHTKSMGMLNIHSSSSAIAMASCPYQWIKRHSCTLLPSWLMPKASSTGLSLDTYTGCTHCTLTWASQAHSKACSGCINASGLYIFNLTWHLISWPSHTICWY